MDIGQPALAVRHRLAHVKRFLQQHSGLVVLGFPAMQVPPFFTREQPAGTSEECQNSYVCVNFLNTSGCSVLAKISAKFGSVFSSITTRFMPANRRRSSVSFVLCARSVGPFLRFKITPAQRSPRW